MCTVVLSFAPDDRVPLLLLGVRDELTGRPWRPPARHWPGSPLTGGIDEQAGGTWLALHPAAARVSCLLNGRGPAAAPARRRSRGELPLRAALDGPGALKDLAADPARLAAYDPFYLVCADTGAVLVLSWDGADAECADLPPGTHMLTNAGHAYPAPEVTEPKALRFAGRFAAARPSGEPAAPLAAAWAPWLALTDGDALLPGDPAAIVARRTLPDGRQWGSTSQTLIALGRDGGPRYDFRPVPGDWYEVPLA
ncbi:MAG TPA: NRDE family protein [Trebonia sp.]|jgi:hypothetical protein|nr:NRDE family protein [Trebonia sp.]